MSFYEQMSYEERQRKMILERHIRCSELMLLGRDKLEKRNWDETYFDLLTIWLTAFNYGEKPERGNFTLMHDNLMLAFHDVFYGDGAIFSKALEGARERGLEHYLDAYLAGVPVDDIVG